MTSRIVTKMQSWFAPKAPPPEEQKRAQEAAHSSRQHLQRELSLLKALGEAMKKETEDDA